MILSLLSVIIKLLKSRNCFVVSLLYDLIINLAIFSSRDLIFVNLIIFITNVLYTHSAIML